jgi:uncharacterized protein with PQ loop repeat
MNDYRAILRRTGWILIAIGVLDIIWLFASIAYQQSYSSSLIFSVFAGIFLIRGNLTVVRWVLWFAIFLVTVSAGLLVAFPFLQPISLTWTQLQSATSSAISSSFFAVFTLVLIYWVIRQLNSEAVKAALVAHGKTPVASTRPVAIGFLFVLVLLCISVGMQRTNSAKKAIEQARKQFGSEYQYHFSSFNSRTSNGTTKISTTVLAWKSGEVKEIRLNWEE